MMLYLPTRFLTNTNYNDAYLKKLADIAIEFTWRNYDYLYLKAMHERNRIVGTRTMIAGSSHARNGIVEEYIRGGVINFSVTSQDIYYDFLHIKKAIKEGKQKIKNCIINLGYFSLYADVSQSRTGRDLIERTYYPIFRDAHHHTVEKDFDMLSCFSYDKNMYSAELIRNVCETWSGKYFLEHPAYYGSLRTRENYGGLCIQTPQGIQNVIWNTLDEKTKEAIAVSKAEEHNVLKCHEQSCKENSDLINQITAYLHEHNITPVFVIFPFTTLYNKHVDKDFKPEILDVLESLPYPVEFLDMNDYEGIFDDSDFIDADHLNIQGAVKATEFLNEFITMIEEAD